MPTYVQECNDMHEMLYRLENFFNVRDHANKIGAVTLISSSMHTAMIRFLSSSEDAIASRRFSDLSEDFKQGFHRP